MKALESAKNLWRKTGSLSTALILPVVAIAIMAGIFNQPTLEDLPIAVVQQDFSSTSRKIVQDLDQSPLLKVVQITPTLAEAQKSMDQGLVYGILHLDYNLEKNALKRQSPASTLWTNGQWLLINNIMAKEVRNIFGFYGKTFSRENLKDPITTSLRPLYNPELNYQVYLLWAIIPAIWQLAIMISTIRMFPRGTQMHSFKVKFQRVLRAWLFFICAGILSLLWQASVQQISFSAQQWQLWILAFTLLTSVNMAMSFSWISWTQNSVTASSFAAFVGGPALAFSGMTFPQMAMPKIAQIWSSLLPSTPFLEAQTKILVIQASSDWVKSSLFTLLYMLAFWLTLSLIGEYRQKRIAKKYLEVENEKA